MSLKGKYLELREFREKYKPLEIKYLLIAESLPASNDEEIRFFYNPNQEKWDFLFESIMSVVFPDFINIYKKGHKHENLQRFKKAGFYMIDAVDTPINNLSEEERNKRIELESKNKIKEISKLISSRTPVFLIKKNIFNIFYPKIKNKYNVAHAEFLPFPSSGQQLKFKEKFKYYLYKVYNPKNVGNIR